MTNQKKCQCNQYQLAQLKSAKRKSGLREVECTRCKTRFWTNKTGEILYCFACETKKGK
ncbi:MAG: hypothetical protein N3A72_06730 [bacterium]|nr:hypothetical protein [bacterium]